MIPRGHRGVVVVSAVAALLAGSACARVARVPPRAPSLDEAIASPDAAEQLRRDLRGFFTDHAVDHAEWGVTVQSLKTGDLLYSLNAFRLLVPASNQKLITSAVAADRLGWDFRYTTRLYATGPVSNGTLQGDLVVVGNGDPTINPRHPDRWGAFDAWARQLADQGIRIVAGELVGDDSAFESPGWGPGWSWDDLALGYGAQVGALQYNENQVELMVGPGLEAGARAIISVSPPGSGLTIDHGVTTVAPGEATRVTIDRVPGSTVLRVRGQIAAGDKPVIRLAAVANPTTLYLNALREALERHGIFVGGNVADIDDLRVRPAVDTATLLLEDRSAPLTDIIDVCLKESRNEYAETLLRTIALPEKPATADTGLRAVNESMRAWGIFPEYFLARDGSGLSRYDWVAPNALSWVLTYMYLDPYHAEHFRHALPIAGVDGSLEDRMKGTPAEGRVFAKTGSMSQVRSLSGYITTLDGEPLVFSIIVNGFRVPSRQIDEVVDRAMVRLVQYKR